MTPFTFACLIGALIVLALEPFGGGRDVVDTGMFYVLGLPAGIAAAAVFAWHWPRGAWRYGIAVAFGQCAAAFILAGEFGNLFPLTLTLFAALGLPMVLVAAVTGWLRRRLGDDAGGRLSHDV